MTTRATHSNVYIDRRGRRMEHMSMEHRIRLRKAYIAQSPGWRHPLVGYVLCPFVVALSVVCTLFLQKWLGTVSFPGSLHILAVLFLALLWGVGPSLFAVALSTLLLDYYFVPPLGHILSGSWQDSMQLLPFVVAGFSIALITAQRERARLRALGAEQELYAYAEELEEINQRLEGANQAKDQFLSIASHELKTPITIIRGQAQMMMRRLARQKTPLSEIEAIGTTLGKINDQTTRLTVLIEELMDVSSIRAGKIELKKQKSDIRVICREVIEDQQMLTGRMITLNVPEKLVTIQVDYDRMEQVFVNLVGNAIKYSSDASPIEVTISEREHKVLIQVEDHGKGIPPELQERIFETFYRTPDAQSSSTRGLGLGLAISKDIVERHKGRIWCESVVGKGSTFFVELPMR